MLAPLQPAPIPRDASAPSATTFIADFFTRANPECVDSHLASYLASVVSEEWSSCGRELDAAAAARVGECLFLAVGDLLVSYEICEDSDAALKLLERLGGQLRERFGAGLDAGALARATSTDSVASVKEGRTIEDMTAEMVDVSGHVEHRMIQSNVPAENENMRPSDEEVTRDRIATDGLSLKEQKALAAQGLGECELCERYMPLTRHHLLPRAVHARLRKIDRARYTRELLNTCANVCRPCHSAIHSIADNVTLAKEFFTIERLRAHEPVARAVAYFAKQAGTTKAEAVNPKLHYAS